jgi:hypothetical protein
MKLTSRALRIMIPLILLLPLATRALPLLSPQLSGGPFSVGATFTLSVRIDAVSDLYAYQFDLHYDPLVLAAQTVIEGTLLSNVGSTSFIPGTVDNRSGLIAFTGDSLIGPIGGATGAGTLVELIFLALGNGSSPISIDNVLLLDSSMTVIAPTIINDGSVMIGPTAMPEPGTLPLVLLVGAGVAFARCRRFWPVPVIRHS